jgi:hypothetical protein
MELSGLYVDVRSHDEVSPSMSGRCGMRPDGQPPGSQFPPGQPPGSQFPGGQPMGVAPWRVRSSSCALIDGVFLVAGLCTLVIVGLDAVVSWPSNRVLVDPSSLSDLAEAVLIPGWLWLLATAALLRGDSGVSRRSQLARRGRVAPSNQRARPPWAVRAPVWAKACAVVVATASVTTAVGSLVAGGAKGSGRVLPGPRYEISAMNLNQSRWTVVSGSQYRLWQAQFVREEAPLVMFFLVLVLLTGYLLLAHFSASSRSAPG